jgi:hypothetical protein
MRPKGSDVRRQGVPHFFNFTGCDLFRQKLKHSRNPIRREKQGIGLEGAVDARDEVSSVALLHRRRGRAPVLGII